MGVYRIIDLLTDKIKVFWIEKVGDEFFTFEYRASLLVITISFIAFIFLLPVIITICYFVLLVACFLKNFSKPLRIVFGIGIPILSIFIYTYFFERNAATGTETELIKLSIATLMWLAPLMAIARRPLYVLGGFITLCYIVPLLYMGGIYCFNNWLPPMEYSSSDPFSPLISFAIFFFVFIPVMAYLTFVLPIFLFIKGFKKQNKNDKKNGKA